MDAIDAYLVDNLVAHTRNKPFQQKPTGVHLLVDLLVERLTSRDWLRD